MADDRSGIWLKVSNARFDGSELLVQLEGDRHDQEAVWWPVSDQAYDEDQVKTFRAVLDGLDKKRTVLAMLKPGESGLACSTIRIQHTEARLS